MKNVDIPILALFVWEGDIFVSERICHWYTKNKYLGSQRWLKAFETGFYSLIQTSVKLRE